MSSVTWQVMQIVETNRHEAEQLEQRASVAGAASNELLLALAAHKRALADHAFAQYLHRQADSRSKRRH